MGGEGKAGIIVLHACMPLPHFILPTFLDTGCRGGREEEDEEEEEEKEEVEEEEEDDGRESAVKRKQSFSVEKKL